MKKFSISEQAIDLDALKQSMLHDQAGAFICFEGWVRNHHDGRTVQALGYQAYSALAETEGKKILEEACKQFAILDAVCVHRIGDLRERQFRLVAPALVGGRLRATIRAQGPSYKRWKVVAPPTGLGARISQYRCCLPALAEFSTYRREGPTGPP